MNTKRTGIMLLILLSLSGCAAPEQEESTYIAESSDHKDDFESGEEQDENHIKRRFRKRIRTGDVRL